MENTGTTAAPAEKKNDKHVHFYGHVAKFPRNTKAKSAYLFMENVKVPKNRVWYVMVQKQDNELQMIKYNRVAGVNLQTFVEQLCVYYGTQYAEFPEVQAAMALLEVSGEDKFAIIRNISPIKIGGQPMISKITEDLIKLLA